MSSVRQLKCPMPKCQLPMPKTTFIESAIYPPSDVTPAYYHVSISFVLRGKENLLCLLEVVKFKFLFVKSLQKKYNCTMEQFSFERYHHGFSTGLKVILTNNLCIISPRFRGEAVAKIYKGPSRKLLTDP